MNLNHLLVMLLLSAVWVVAMVASKRSRSWFWLVAAIVLAIGCLMAQAFVVAFAEYFYYWLDCRNDVSCGAALAACRCGGLRIHAALALMALEVVATLGLPLVWRFRRNRPAPKVMPT
jgi:hypothetical protein